ncbi:uncharacterized protein [Amphiura filiformis]|uniref:uncharacterized protein n=1 Tax=Amphiura filiformis TaxID=82378 RepID=UPI003B21A628
MTSKRLTLNDDECLTSPCDSNAACSNNPGSFECTCNAGFSGDGLTCTDDDECLTSPCDSNAACSNNPGSFECTCNAGFSGDGLTCTDDDECLTSPCDSNAACSNNPGSFECTCNAGFSGDGLTCTDDDECLTSPCDSNAACSNNPGSFECTCNAGFSGDGLTCTACYDYLGMESGEIRDADITASSEYSTKFLAVNARLNGNAAWSASVSATEWIQADIGYLTYALGVITQGDGGYGSGDDWITSFKVSTFLSIDDNEMFVVNQDGTEIIFPGNTDTNTKVTANFPAPIHARIVRITCLTAKGIYGLRFEILGCKM